MPGSSPPKSSPSRKQSRRVFSEGTTRSFSWADTRLPQSTTGTSYRGGDGLGTATKTSSSGEEPVLDHFDPSRDFFDDPSRSCKTPEPMEDSSDLEREPEPVTPERPAHRSIYDRIRRFTSSNATPDDTSTPPIPSVNSAISTAPTSPSESKKRLRHLVKSVLPKRHTTPEPDPIAIAYREMRGEGPPISVSSSSTSVIPGYPYLSTVEGPPPTFSTRISGPPEPVTLPKQDENEDSVPETEPVTLPKQDGNEDSVPETEPVTLPDQEENKNSELESEEAALIDFFMDDDEFVGLLNVGPETNSDSVQDRRREEVLRRKQEEDSRQEQDEIIRRTLRILTQ